MMMDDCVLTPIVLDNISGYIFCTERDGESLVYDLLQYNCKTVKYDPHMSAYMCTWKCKVDRCSGRAETFKQVVNDVSNATLKMKDINTFGTYVNCNFRVLRRHDSVMCVSISNYETATPTVDEITDKQKAVNGRKVELRLKHFENNLKHWLGHIPLDNINSGHTPGHILESAQRKMAESEDELDRLAILQHNVLNKSHLRQAQRLVAESKVREPFTEVATSIDTNLWPADKYKQKLLFHGKKEMLNKKRARKGVKFITQTIMVFGCEQLLCNLFKSDRAFI